MPRDFNLEALLTENVISFLVFVAVHSPSIDPIPFLLASESFPLAERETVYLEALRLTFMITDKLLHFAHSCSVAIAVKLFFAGILTLCHHELDHALEHWGGLAIFSGLNVAASVLVFFLVEKTTEFSLEDLSMVFAVPKREFVMFQLGYLEYRWRRYALESKEDEPDFYTVAFHHRRNIREQDEDSVIWGD